MYTNILSLEQCTDDHCRVKLKELAGVENSDYINASYLDVRSTLRDESLTTFVDFGSMFQGYQKPNAYIAAQGKTININIRSGI